MSIKVKDSSTWLISQPAQKAASMSQNMDDDN